MAGAAGAMRMFVALYPPSDVTDALRRSLVSLNLPPHRQVPIDLVHMTLLFLGNVDPRHLEETIESVQRSTAGLGAFEVSVLEFLPLPKRGASRLIAAETNQPPAMMELQRRLAQRLSRKPRRSAGERFLPHITLARFRPPTELDRAAVRCAVDVPPFIARSIQLMRSTLSPSGAVHQLVEDVELTES